MSAEEFADKVVLVTGAGSGIGRGIADAFGDAGAVVIAVGRTQRRLTQTVEGIRRRGGRAVTLVCDVSDESQVEQMATAVSSEHGPVDVLVNNAGFGPAAPAGVLDTELEEWNRVLGTSLTGAMLCAKHVGRHLRERRSGAIVNITSLAGKLPRVGMAPYCAAKAGLDQLTRVLALELAADGIRVNAVSPGTVRTEHLESGLSRDGASFDERVRGNLERFRSPIPLGRVGTPDDAASAVLFLASEAAAFITGQILYVDGGAGML